MTNSADGPSLRGRRCGKRQMSSNSRARLDSRVDFGRVGDVPDESPPLRLEFSIAHEPRGKVYARLLEALFEECHVFSLVYTPFWMKSGQVLEFRARLQPYLVHEGPASEWPGTTFTQVLRDLPVLATYQVVDETRGLLLEPMGLYQWKGPQRPEDLALYDAAGQFWLGSTTHERLGRLSVPPDFLSRLKSVPNLRLAKATGRQSARPQRSSPESSSEPANSAEAGLKLANFMQGFAAAVELDARAAKQGCFVESVCLTASLIDGLLRMGLILKHQLETASSLLLEELLYQADDDRAVLERAVYRRALESSVIDRATFDELQSLYDDRNRVVHRYIISAITTSEVLHIAMRMDAVKHRVSDQVAVLEKEQIRLGVGMTRQGEAGAKVDNILDMATGKHGDAGLAQALREEPDQ